MKKLNYILIIIGVILMVSPYFFNQYSLFRLISVLIGVVLTLIGIIANTKYRTAKILVFPILFISAVYTLDFMIYKTFAILPTVIVERKSSDKVSTYNSLFYRIYNCDEKLVLDENYQKRYQCKASDLKLMPINKMLENPKERYQEYLGSFVHLEGKINKIVGNNSLSLNAYELAEKTVNGYVVFDEEKSVVVTGLEINPADYYIYDYIEVVGLVDSYTETDGVYEITLKDAIIVPTDIYEEYELIVNNLYTAEKVNKGENLYFVGIQGIYYRYAEDVIYELEYLLSDKRESIENIIGDTEKEIINEEDELYTLDDFKIIQCAEGDTLFVNKYIYYYANLCKPNEN